MTELEIEMNNSIIDLIHRLEAVMNNDAIMGHIVPIVKDFFVLYI